MGQDADAAFFNLMHHFLAAAQQGEGGAGQNETGAERRSESRRPFRLTQRIAPGFCWEVPPESAWIEVPCYDLAKGGFSFFLDEKPTFRAAGDKVPYGRTDLLGGAGGLLASRAG